MKKYIWWVIGAAVAFVFYKWLTSHNVVLSSLTVKQTPPPGAMLTGTVAGYVPSGTTGFTSTNGVGRLGFSNQTANGVLGK